MSNSEQNRTETKIIDLMDVLKKGIEKERQRRERENRLAPPETTEEG